MAVPKKGPQWMNVTSFHRAECFSCDTAYKNKALKERNKLNSILNFKNMLNITDYA